MTIKPRTTLPENTNVPASDKADNISTIERPRIHLGYVDSLRGLAALYVVFFHCYLASLNATQYPTGGIRLLTTMWTFGHQAVDLFIVISGFCLMLPTLHQGYTIRGGFISFLKKRAKRILPPFYVALCLSITVAYVVSGHHALTIYISSIKRDVLSHVFLVQDAIPGANDHLQSVLWSISVEWRIYIAMPLLLLLWRRGGPILTVACTTILVSLFVFLLPYLGLNADPWEPIGASPQYLLLFVFGMVASDVSYGNKEWHTRWRRVPWVRISVIALIVGIVSVRTPLTIWQGKTTPYPITDLFFGTAAAGLLVYFSRPDASFIKRVLNHRILTWLGTFAYSIYLVHMMAIRLVATFILPQAAQSFTVTFFCLTFILIPIIVLLAYLFFLAFERPFLSQNAKRAIVQQEHRKNVHLA